MADLIDAIVKEGNTPKEWNNNSIISLFKGKSTALERGSYCFLKLTDQVLKVFDRSNKKNHLRLYKY